MSCHQMIVHLSDSFLCPMGEKIASRASVPVPRGIYRWVALYVPMRWPHGIAVLDSTLFIADAGNNRVMAWREIPCMNGAPCPFHRQIAFQKEFLRQSGSLPASLMSTYSLFPAL